jgi:GcrA cell cycle regulator
MQINWPPEHSDALREYFAKRMSYSEIAEAINAKFGTAYSRNAALGRAKRMGLAGPEPAKKPNHWPKLPSKASLCKRREHHRIDFMRPMPDFARTETAPLRCVEIVPRHLSLVELEFRDCRYPYGGDAEGEAITFCGHRRRTGSSYCAPHFHLTRGPAATAEKAVSTAALRLVKTA